jgi:hypothetical protein
MADAGHAAAVGRCSVAEEACSASEEACPAFEQACPASEEACPAFEQACSASEEACPATEEACSASEEACSAAEKACSASEKASSVTGQLASRRLRSMWTGTAWLPFVTDVRPLARRAGRQPPRSDTASYLGIRNRGALLGLSCWKGRGYGMRTNSRFHADDRRWVATHTAPTGRHTSSPIPYTASARRRTLHREERNFLFRAPVHDAEKLADSLASLVRDQTMRSRRRTANRELIKRPRSFEKNVAAVDELYLDRSSTMRR